jgi:hypothetical protein
MDVWLPRREETLRLYMHKLFTRSRDKQTKKKQFVIETRLRSNSRNTPEGN